MADELTLRVSVLNATRAGFRAVLTSVKGFGRAAGSVFKGIARTVTNIAKSVVALGASVVGITALTLRSFVKQEEAEIRLAAVIKATGQAAGFTIGQLKKQAAELAKLTAVGDQEILNLQAILATFKEVKGDEFREATSAILDMALVMQGEAKSGAIQLGKALNAPILGVSALAEVGVSFTEQQKETIKSFVESGKIMEAQKIILRELRSEFGGTARALRDSLGGSIKVASNSFGGFLERVGQVLAETFNLRRVFEDAAVAIDALAESGKLEQWAKNVKRFLQEALDVMSALIEGGERREIVLRGFGKIAFSFLSIVGKGLLFIAPEIGRLIAKGMASFASGAIQEGITDPAEARRVATARVEGKIRQDRTFRGFTELGLGVGRGIQRREIEAETVRVLQEMRETMKISNANAARAAIVGSGINPIWDAMLLEMKANTVATQDLKNVATGGGT